MFNILIAMFFFSFFIQLSQLKLPNCWMKAFFMGYILSELHLDDAALNLYDKLYQGVFEHSLYVKSQIAKIHYSLRG